MRRKTQKSSAPRRIRAAAPRGCPQNASEMKPSLVLLLAAATADDDFILKQLTDALGKPATPRALADVFIDDRFEYLRDEADYTFEAGDADKVVEAFSRRITTNVPVIDLQATFENCSALCAFLEVGVPEHVEAYVLLSLGSAAFGSPFHPATLRTLGRTCGKTDRDLEKLLLDPKLRRWFVAQHFPRVVITGGMGRGRYGNDAVGDVSRSTSYVLHPKLHHVPLGLPRALSPHLEREKAWFDANRGPRSADVYVNHKPRPYRERILGHLRRALGQALPNNYAGKAALRSGTETYVGDLFRHAIVLSPPGSGVDCYRHYEALLCGAVPLLEYSPLAVELLAGLPYIMVRSWAEVSAPFLERELAQLKTRTFDWRRLTRAYWRDELARARISGELPARRRKPS